MGQLAHGVELAGNTFASGNAGLSTASENFFDCVESSVIDAFSEGEVKGVGGGNMVEREHLKGFEDGKRNAAERMDRGGIEGRCDGASPLQSEGGGDLLFGGKAKFFRLAPRSLPNSSRACSPRPPHKNRITRHRRR